MLARWRNVALMLCMPFESKVPDYSLDVLIAHGQDNEGKARQAFADENYRRMADKGVWACGFYAEAISRGAGQLMPNLHQSALLAFYGNALWGDDAGWIEKPIFEDYKKVGL